MQQRSLYSHLPLTSGGDEAIEKLWARIQQKDVWNSVARSYLLFHSAWNCFCFLIGNSQRSARELIDECNDVKELLRLLHGNFIEHASTCSKAREGDVLVILPWRSARRGFVD
jgi:hypothetical protein